uniref:Uncharacterized protein n=1 Tax=Ranid herpesvirus 4 TaxID=2849006 RepID=A0A8F3CIL6_9VIRU|nr:MAG: hypothetical protein [Ranid herpesvirus 4]
MSDIDYSLPTFSDHLNDNKEDANNDNNPVNTDIPINITPIDTITTEEILPPNDQTQNETETSTDTNPAVPPIPLIEPLNPETELKEPIIQLPNNKPKYSDFFEANNSFRKDRDLEKNLNVLKNYLNDNDQKISSLAWATPNYICNTIFSSKIYVDTITISDRVAQCIVQSPKIGLAIFKQNYNKELELMRRPIVLLNEFALALLDDRFDNWAARVFYFDEEMTDLKEIVTLKITNFSEAFEQKTKNTWMMLENMYYDIERKYGKIYSDISRVEKQFQICLLEFKDALKNFYWAASVKGLVPFTDDINTANMRYEDKLNTDLSNNVVTAEWYKQLVFIEALFSALALNETSNYELIEFWDNTYQACFSSNLQLIFRMILIGNFDTSLLNHLLSNITYGVDHVIINSLLRSIHKSFKQLTIRHAFSLHLLEDHKDLIEINTPKPLKYMILENELEPVNCTSILEVLESLYNVKPFYSENTVLRADILKLYECPLSTLTTPVFVKQSEQEQLTDQDRDIWKTISEDKDNNLQNTTICVFNMSINGKANLVYIRASSELCYLPSTFLYIHPKLIMVGKPNYGSLQLVYNENTLLFVVYPIPINNDALPKEPFIEVTTRSLDFMNEDQAEYVLLENTNYIKVLACFPDNNMSAVEYVQLFPLPKWDVTTFSDTIFVPLFERACANLQYIEKKGRLYVDLATKIDLLVSYDHNIKLEEELLFNSVIAATQIMADLKHAKTCADTLFKIATDSELLKVLVALYELRLTIVTHTLHDAIPKCISYARSINAVQTYYKLQDNILKTRVVLEKYNSVSNIKTQDVTSLMFDTLNLIKAWNYISKQLDIKTTGFRYYISELQNIYVTLSLYYNPHTQPRVKPTKKPVDYPFLI